MGCKYNICRVCATVVADHGRASRPRNDKRRRQCPLFEIISVSGTLSVRGANRIPRHAQILCIDNDIWKMSQKGAQRQLRSIEIIMCQVNFTVVLLPFAGTIIPT